MDAVGLLSRHGHRVSGNGQYTFINLARSSRWKVDNINMSAFMVDYCTRLRELLEGYVCPSVDSNAELSRSICNIMQKGQSEMSVVFDLHLDYSQLIGEPCPAHFLYSVINSIQQAIVDTYILNDTDDDDEERDELLCILTGWPEPVIIRDSRPGHLAEDCYRYRYMFHFPCCRVESNTLSKLSKRVYSNLRSNNAMGMLTQTPIGDWDVIFKPVINDPLPLYGSSEKPEYPPCFYIGLYGDLSTCSIDSFDPRNSYDLSILNINEHSAVRRGIINSEEIESSGEDFSPEELLPVILYGTYGNNTCIIRESILDDDRTPTASNTVPILGEGPYFLTEKTNEDILNELLPLVAHHRYTNRLNWIDIGKAIYHTYKGSEEGLSVWIGSTEKALEKVNVVPDFLEGSTVAELCTQLYSEFGDRVHITFKTVVWYAMEDNPEQYKNWHVEWSHAYLQRCLTLQEDEIAKAIYCDLWLTYAVPGNGCKFIYRFRDNRWTRVDGGYTIRLYITDEFKRRFEVQRANIYRSMTESHDESYRERMEVLGKKVSLLIDKLGKHATKEKLVRELMDRFVVEDLESFMDSNGNLTGLPNGIAEADFQQRTIRVRPGKPEDYISRTTLVRVNDRYSWQHPLVKEFMDWMGKMFPNEETRKYVFKFLASLWIAGNQDKILPDFSGEAGNNSKSTFARCIFKAWGAYAIKFPTTGLTRGYSDSGSANPAWARLSGPRIAFADETDEGEHFRSGPAKLITGNDDFYGRKLFADGGDLTSTATVAVFSNRVIPWKGADDAIRKRFFVLPCISQWRDDNVPETEEEQYNQRIFPNDPNFINRVIHLSPALLWVSFQYFPIWAAEGLRNKPQEIEDATESYWSENDIYRMYTSDRIMEGDAMDSLSVNQVHEDFEAWFLRYNRGQTPPDVGTVRYHITQLWNPPVGGRWYGIRLIPQNETNEGGFNQPQTVFNPEAVTKSITSALRNAKKKTTPAKATPSPARINFTRTPVGTPAKTSKLAMQSPSPGHATKEYLMLHKTGPIGPDGKPEPLNVDRKAPVLSTLS